MAVNFTRIFLTQFPRYQMHFLSLLKENLAHAVHWIFLRHLFIAPRTISLYIFIIFHRGLAAQWTRNQFALFAIVSAANLYHLFAPP